ncbi:MAG TPA: branched-chain amino acid ABC transporter substrate-binding protein [Acidimicrobiales bacterium]|nr:branched-chain amino acid ABC transporter substrate-binding protein [Acidimicrobiales bacterium]
MGRSTVRLGVGALGLPVAALLAAGVPWAQSAGAARSAKQPVDGLIAVEGPMTGAQSTTGIDMANGAQIAIDQINAAGGVDGVKLSLLKLDDKATAAGGIAAEHRAVTAHAFGVVGPFNSSVGVANLSLYRKAGLPIVRLTSSVKTEGFGVTTQPMDSQVAPVEIKEITQVLHAARPAIVYDTSTYTAGIANQVKAGLTKAGDPVVAMVPVTSTQTNFNKALQKVKGAHPGLLYISAYGAEAGAIAKAGYAVNTSAAGGTTGSCFVDLAAQGAAFGAAATQQVASSCVSSGVPSAQQFAGASQYVADYQSMFHTSPGTWGTFTYDSVEVLANAVKQAGWHQAAVGTAMDHTTGYQGVTGPITIAPSTGNRVQSTVVILDVNDAGSYVIDPKWAAATGFPFPSAG